MAVSKAKMLKAGYMYLAKYKFNSYCCLVCIGKCMSRESDMFEFVMLSPYVLDIYDVQSSFTKNIRFWDIQLKDLKCLKRISKTPVVEPNVSAIRAWLTQLKLSGYIFENSFSFDTYLGDWTKRTKLKSVTKNFKVGAWYIKEPLASAKQCIPYTGQELVFYCGSKDGDYFRWYACLSSVVLQNDNYVDRKCMNERVPLHENKEIEEDLVEVCINAERYQI